MSQSLQRRKAPALGLLVFMVFALVLVTGGAAFGEGAPYQEVSGYPKYGCFDVATTGRGMWSGNTPYTLRLDVPGPVVDAYLMWVGTQDLGAPNAPNQSDLDVNGATILGNKVDSKAIGPYDADWYMWRADVGPKGANLIQQGTNKLDITGWEAVNPTDVRRNGISLVVVYKTGACARPNQVDVFDNMDYYWERTVNEGTTDAMTFTFPPAPVEREGTFYLHHAGTDHINTCREENIWEASGTGTAPNSIVYYYANPPVGSNGGHRVVENAFVSSTCGTTVWHAPVTSLTGWVDGQGPSANVGGNISPQWSVVKLTVKIPAGATWLILQAESEKTGAKEVTSTGESGAWFGQGVIPLYNPELKIAKSDGVDLAAPGDKLTYTVNYENYGYGPAADVTIVDKLPEHVSYVSATNGGVYDSATHTVKWNVGTVDIGQGGQVSVTVELDPVFVAGTSTLTNSASISTSTPGEMDLTDNTASDPTDVFAKAELSITKKAAPEPVDAGTNLTYTVDWVVGGNAFADAVTIVDTLPGNVSFVSATDGGLYDPTQRTVTWLLGDVTPVTDGSYQVTVKVATPLYNGTKLTNAAVITDKAGDKANTSVISTVRSSHELKIEKTASPDPVEAGSDLTYTIKWAVTGNEPAKNATVVDTLPAGVTFVNASDGGVYDPATRKVTWNLGELMTPKNGTLTVVVNVPAPQYNNTELVNTVGFSDETPGSTPVQATTTSTIHADHVLTIAKTDAPDPVEKGAELTYTISWGVTGNEYADDIVVTDPIPFGTQFVSATDGGVYDPATNTVTWTVGDKVPGDTGSFSVVVKVNKDFPNGLQIINQATISDYKPGKEQTADQKTNVVQTPEGSIGDTVWYDTNGNGIQEPGEPGISGVGLVLYNAGPDGLCGTADDLAVANTTTDASGKYLFTGVAAGSYCVDVLNATVPAGLVLTGGHDPNGPIVLADGQKYKDADFGYGPGPDTGVIGDRVWSDANGNGVQDPGEVGIGGVTLDLVKAGPDGLCGTADDTIAAQTTTAGDGSYLFTGVVPGVYCVNVTDTGNVLTGLTLTGGADPAGPITLAAGQTYLAADFGYKGDKFAGSIGDLVFYDGNRNGVFEPGPTERGIGGVTLSLVTAGPDGKFGTADDVVVATTTTADDGSYLFTGLPDGTYQVVVTDLNGRLPGYTQTYGLPNTNNNGQTSPYTATITGGNAVLTADFSYADGHILTVRKVNDVPAGKPVEAGADMVYTISYSVSGREAAPNVVLKDPMPMQVEFLEASNGGTYDPVTRLVTWNLGTLEPGTSGSVTVKVHVKMPLPNNSYIFNTVTIVDDAKVTDEATDIVRVHAEPILSLTKTADPAGEVKPGDTLTYNLCYANTGNGNATGAVLTDVIPLNTTYVPGSASAGAVYNEATQMLTWNVGTIAPGANVCASFKVTVNLTIVGLTGQANVAMSFAEWNALTIDNKATLKADQGPEKVAQVSNPLNATVKPEIFKVASTAKAHMGETVVFTVTLKNSGTANATNVVLTDGISPNLEEVSLTTSKGTASYNAATRVWTVNVGVLGPNETVTVVITAKTIRLAEIPTGKPETLLYTITNMATVAFTEGAPRQSNEVTVDVYYFFMPNEVPEPGTLLLLGSGLAGLAGYAQLRVRSRRRKND